MTYAQGQYEHKSRVNISSQTACGPFQSLTPPSIYCINKTFKCSRNFDAQKLVLRKARSPSLVQCVSQALRVPPCSCSFVRTCRRQARCAATKAPLLPRRVPAKARLGRWRPHDSSTLRVRHAPFERTEMPERSAAQGNRGSPPPTIYSPPLAGT